MNLLLILQLPMQMRLARDPKGNAPWYCAAGIPLFCWSMLAGCACAALREVLGTHGCDRRRCELRRQRRCRQIWPRPAPDVILLERDLKRKKPCGGAIPPKAMSEFGIPRSIIERTVTHAAVIGPSGSEVEMDVRGTRRPRRRLHHDAHPRSTRSRAARERAERRRGAARSDLRLPRAAVRRQDSREDPLSRRTRRASDLRRADRRRRRGLGGRKIGRPQTGQARLGDSRAHRTCPTT